MPKQFNLYEILGHLQKSALVKPLRSLQNLWQEGKKASQLME